MKKGEIYKLKKECKRLYSKDFYKHSFIFWEEEYTDIRGIMLTSKAPPKYNNILLKKEHFKEAFEFKPDNSPTSKSYIAPLYLLKDIKFEHLEKVGEFTEEGINFIKENLSKLTYTDWSTYLKSVK